MKIGRAWRVSRPVPIEIQIPSGFLGVEMVDEPRAHTHQRDHVGAMREHGADHFDSAADSKSNGRVDSGAPLKSRVIKRSIVIGGHRTSVSLEDAFWEGLKEIAKARGAHISDIVCGIDSERQHCNLSSAIRLYVHEHFHK